MSFWSFPVVLIQLYSVADFHIVLVLYFTIWFEQAGGAASNSCYWCMLAQHHCGNLWYFSTTDVISATRALFEFWDFCWHFKKNDCLWGQWFRCLSLRPIFCWSHIKWYFTVPDDCFAWNPSLDPEASRDAAIAFACVQPCVQPVFALIGLRLYM